MYSSKLREDFCWSRPKYYTVPISDPSKNTVDRKIIFDFIEKIRNAFNTYDFAEPLRDYLQDLECVCVCVYQMMLSSSSTDMQLVLHQLDLINRFCSKLKKQKLDEIVKRVQESQIPEYEKADYELAKHLFFEIANEFTNSENSKVPEILDKYRYTIWNRLGSESVIAIICKKDDNIEKEQLWLHNNNYIHCCKVLEMDDNSVTYIKDICKKNGVPLEILWDMPIGDDEWIKKHICDIKTPIFVRMNSVSIYSDKAVEECDYFHIGFDEKELEEGLR